MSDPITLDGASLTPEAVARVAREDVSVVVSDEAREAVRAARERVADVVDAGDAVYGVNTGFGQLVNERIPREDIEQLQTNLIRSHAAGAGRELSREEVRAMMLTRINALVKGFSGIREIVLDHLVTMLNEGVHPIVKSRGSLGASGDLAPLAHMALVLLGEGEAHVDGERLSGAEALARVGLEPLTLASKEGLALINGTQLTVGLGALLVVDAESLLRAADTAGALTTEVTMGTTASCDPALSAVRPHPGQAASARNVKRLTAESEIVESHRNCDRVQDAYSIRCLPQVHGAVREAVRHLRETVGIELNSATDNPLIFPGGQVDSRASGTESAAVLSGGNFHGEVLALRLDYVANALTELAAISERRTDRMVNPNIQEDYLPPFLTEHSGLRSGLMIAQYTAASLLNECRSFGRASADNTPVSGNQEDHVSMSAQAAHNARKTLENARMVLAVELLCGAQAAEFIEDDLAHGVGTAAAYDVIRDVVSPLTDDRELHIDMAAVDDLLKAGVLDDALAVALSEPLE
ncbi:histidine ammonia-lyase [Haladaptatus sp. CMSO5]|uniref:histidine ammonia-lyase n=1 Tax=Haladaptatus sp. CMSO5 TaxID=3120514 RepID=UPI002FCE024F